MVDDATFDALDGPVLLRGVDDAKYAKQYADGEFRAGGDYGTGNYYSTNLDAFNYIGDKNIGHLHAAKLKKDARIGSYRDIRDQIRKEIKNENINKYGKNIFSALEIEDIISRRMMEMGYDAYYDKFTGYVIVLNNRALVVRKSMYDLKRTTPKETLDEQKQIATEVLGVTKNTDDAVKWLKDHKWIAPVHKEVNVSILSDLGKLEWIRQRVEFHKNANYALKWEYVKLNDKIQKKYFSGSINDRIYRELIDAGVDADDAGKLVQQIDNTFKPPKVVVKTVDKKPIKPVVKSVDETPTKPVVKPLDPETQKSVEYIDSLDLKNYANSRAWDDEIKDFELTLKKINEVTWEDGLARRDKPDWFTEEIVGRKIFEIIIYGKENSIGATKLDFENAINKVRKMAQDKVDQAKRFRDDLVGELKRITGIENVEELLKETFDPKNVIQYMGVDKKIMPKIIRENKFKNSAESGKSTFATNGQDRFDQYEKRIFNLPEMNVHEGQNYNKIPKYGFIDNADGITDDQYKVIGGSYGEIIVRFKPEIRPRSTTTLGDSMSMNQKGQDTIATAMKLDDIGADYLVHFAKQYIQSMYKETINKETIAAAFQKWSKTKNVDDLRRALNIPSYVEWQTYGTLTLDHVDEIIIGNSLKEYKRITNALKRAGYGHIKVTINKYRKEFVDIKSGYMEGSDSLSPIDIDNLPDSILSKIMRNRANILYQDSVDIPDELKSIAKKIRQISGITDRVLIEKRSGFFKDALKNDKIPPSLMRDYLREYYRLVALKDKGPLSRDHWVDFKKTKTGWTEDLAIKFVDETPAKSVVKPIDKIPAKPIIKTVDEVVESIDQNDIQVLKKKRNKLYTPMNKIKKKHNKDPEKYKVDPEYQKVTSELNALNRQIRKLEKEQTTKPVAKPVIKTPTKPIIKPTDEVVNRPKINHIPDETITDQRKFVEGEIEKVDEWVKPQEEKLQKDLVKIQEKNKQLNDQYTKTIARLKHATDNKEIEQLNKQVEKLANEIYESRNVERTIKLDLGIDTDDLMIPSLRENEIARRMRERMLRPKGEEADMPNVTIAFRSGDIKEDYLQTKITTVWTTEEKLIGQKVANEVINDFSRLIPKNQGWDTNKPISIVFDKTKNIKHSQAEILSDGSVQIQVGVRNISDLKNTKATIAHELAHPYEEFISKKIGHLPSEEFVQSKLRNMPRGRSPYYSMRDKVDKNFFDSYAAHLYFDAAGNVDGGEAFAIGMEQLWGMWRSKNMSNLIRTGKRKAIKGFDIDANVPAILADEDYWKFMRKYLRPDIDDTIKSTGVTKKVDIDKSTVSKVGVSRGPPENVLTIPRKPIKESIENDFIEARADAGENTKKLEKEYVEKYGKGEKPPGEYEANEVAKLHYGDQKLTMVDDDTFDALEGPVLLRGVEDSKYAKTYADGEFRAGGLYGKGNYYSTNTDAFNYIGNDGFGHLHAVKLKKDARIGSYNELKAKITKEIQDESKEKYGENVISDWTAEYMVHQRIMEMGYDAYYDEATGYVIVLNNRALVARKSMYDLKRATPKETLEEQKRIATEVLGISTNIKKPIKWLKDHKWIAPVHKEINIVALSDTAKLDWIWDRIAFYRTTDYEIKSKLNIYKTNPTKYQKEIVKFEKLQKTYFSGSASGRIYRELIDAGVDTKDAIRLIQQVDSKFEPPKIVKPTVKAIDETPVKPDIDVLTVQRKPIKESIEDDFLVAQNKANENTKKLEKDYIKEHGKNERPPGEYEANEVAKLHYGDQKLTMVSDEEFDALEGPVLLRGVDDAKYAKKYADGEFRGGGNYGTGNYYSTNREAFIYAIDPTDSSKIGHVHAAKLKKGARIGSYDELKPQIEKEIRLENKRKYGSYVLSEKKLNELINQRIMELGYDAIYDEVTGYVIILNNRALAVRKSMYNLKRTTPKETLDEQKRIATEILGVNDNIKNAKKWLGNHLWTAPARKEINVSKLSDTAKLGWIQNRIKFHKDVDEKIKDTKFYHKKYPGAYEESDFEKLKKIEIQFVGNINDRVYRELLDAGINANDAGKLLRQVDNTFELPKPIVKSIDKTPTKTTVNIVKEPLDSTNINALKKTRNKLYTPMNKIKKKHNKDPEKYKADPEYQKVTSELNAYNRRIRQLEKEQVTKSVAKPVDIPKEPLDSTDINALKKTRNKLYTPMNKIKKKHNKDPEKYKADPEYQKVTSELNAYNRRIRQLEKGETVKTTVDIPKESLDSTDIKALEKTRNKLYTPLRKVKQKHNNDPIKYKADPEYQKVTGELNAYNRQINKLKKEQTIKPVAKPVEISKEPLDSTNIDALKKTRNKLYTPMNKIKKKHDKDPIKYKADPEYKKVTSELNAYNRRIRQLEKEQAPKSVAKPVVKPTNEVVDQSKTKHVPDETITDQKKFVEDEWEKIDEWAKPKEQKLQKELVEVQKKEKQLVEKYKDIYKKTKNKTTRGDLDQAIKQLKNLAKEIYMVRKIEHKLKSDLGLDNYKKSPIPSIREQEMARRMRERMMRPKGEEADMPNIKVTFKGGNIRIRDLDSTIPGVNYKLSTIRNGWTKAEKLYAQKIIDELVNEYSRLIAKKYGWNTNETIEIILDKTISIRRSDAKTFSNGKKQIRIGLIDVLDISSERATIVHELTHIYEKFLIKKLGHLPSEKFVRSKMPNLSKNENPYSTFGLKNKFKDEVQEKFGDSYATRLYFDAANNVRAGEVLTLGMEQFWGKWRSQNVNDLIKAGKRKPIKGFDADANIPIILAHEDHWEFLRKYLRPDVDDTIKKVDVDKPDIDVLTVQRKPIVKSKENDFIEAQANAQVNAEKLEIEYIKKHGKDGKPPGRYKTNELIKEQHGDQKLTMVSDEEFDALDGPVLLHGVDDAKYAQKYADGEFRGGGLYGTGNYYSTNLDAFEYVGSDGIGHLHAAKLKKGARIASFQKLLSKIRKEIENENIEKYGENLNTYSKISKMIDQRIMEMGYDAYYDEATGYVIVLNNRALVVRKSMYNLKRATPHETLEEQKRIATEVLGVVEKGQNDAIKWFENHSWTIPIHKKVNVVVLSNAAKIKWIQDRIEFHKDIDYQIKYNFKLYQFNPSKNQEKIDKLKKIQKQHFSENINNRVYRELIDAGIDADDAGRLVRQVDNTFKPSKIRGRQIVDIPKEPLDSTDIDALKKTRNKLYTPMNKIKKKHNKDPEKYKADSEYQKVTNELNAYNRRIRQLEKGETVKTTVDIPKESLDSTDIKALEKTRNKLYTPLRKVKQKHNNDPIKYKADPEYQKVTGELNAYNRRINKLKKEQTIKPVTKPIDKKPAEDVLTIQRKPIKESKEVDFIEAQANARKNTDKLEKDYAKEHGRFERPPGKYESNELAKETYGDQSLTMVDDDTFDALEGPVLLRGVDDIEYAKSYANGEFRASGVFGDGNYYSTNTDAVHYLGGEGKGHLHAVKLKKDARIASFEFFKKVDEEISLENEKKYGIDVISTEDGWIKAEQRMMEMGYDAYYDKSTGYVVVLNNRALVVRKSMYNLKLATTNDILDEQIRIATEVLGVNKKIDNAIKWLEDHEWIAPTHKEINVSKLSDTAKLEWIQQRIKFHKDVDKEITNNSKDDFKQLEELKSRFSGSINDRIYRELLDNGVDIKDAVRLIRQVDNTFKPPKIVKPIVKSVDETPIKPDIKVLTISRKPIKKNNQDDFLVTQNKARENTKKLEKDYIKEHGENERPPGSYDVNEIAKEKYGDQSLTMVDDVTFDALDSPVLLRGVEDVKYAQKYADGEFRANGYFGPGNYYSTFLDALGYIGDEGKGHLHAAKFKKGARVATDKELKEAMNEITDEIMAKQKSISEDLYLLEENELLHRATLRLMEQGYDAIYTVDEGYFVVFNNRALVVRESMYNLKRATQIEVLEEQKKIVAKLLGIDPSKTLDTRLEGKVEHLKVKKIVKTWLQKNQLKRPKYKEPEIVNLSDEAKIEWVRQRIEMQKLADQSLKEFAMYSDDVFKKEVTEHFKVDLNLRIYRELLDADINVDDAVRLIRQVDNTFEPPKPVVKTVDKKPTKPVVKSVDETPDQPVVKPLDPETQKVVEYIDSLDLKNHAHNIAWDDEIKYLESILKGISEATWEDGLTWGNRPDWVSKKILGEKTFDIIIYGKSNSVGGTKLDFENAINQVKQSTSEMIDQTKRFRDDLIGELKRITGVENVEDLLKETFDPKNVAQYIGIDKKNMPKIIRDNKFKNSAESGKSASTTTAQERFDKFEKRIFNLPDMDLNNSQTYDLLPKYGFLGSADNISDAQYEVIGRAYGEIIVRFKTDIRPRSTTTIGDSMDMNQELALSIAPAMKINDIGIDFLVNFARLYVREMPKESEVGKQRFKKMIAAFRKWSKTKNINDLRDAVDAESYTEWQVYGILTLDNVDEIIIGNSVKEYKRITSALKKAGYGHIKVTVNKYRKELDKLKAGFIEASDSLSPTDIDNLPDSIISDIMSTRPELLLESSRLIPNELKPLANKIRQIIGVTNTTSRKEKYKLFRNAMRNNKIPNLLIRNYLHEYYRLVALKQNGPLPKIYWKEFRKTDTDWTEDLVDKSILNN